MNIKFNNLQYILVKKDSENVQESDDLEQQQEQSEPYDLVNGYKVDVPDCYSLVEFP